MKKENNKLTELVKQVKELQVKIKKEGQFALTDAFADFFNAYPIATKIVWSQCTPYFNDGDTCRFSVHEFELKVNPNLLSDDVKKFYSSEDEDDHNHGESCFSYALKSIENTPENRKKLLSQDSWNKERYDGVTLRDLTKEEKNMLEDFKELESSCHQIPEILETILGDHVIVTATKEGFKISDYDHE
jgi:hypothetical protein